jgi:glycerol-3-phosphate O-acyltransferase / dihydroxyacetone phosphate acyltransferase
MKPARPHDLHASSRREPTSAESPTARRGSDPRDALADASDRHVAADIRRWSTWSPARRVTVALLFAIVNLATRAAVHVYFAHVQVRHRERFPRRGPVLLVANHPAMWTDVMVLDSTLGRKLHFLTQGALFRPWWRGALLALHGAMPVTPSTSAPEAPARNAETFRNSGRLFAEGKVIAVFPEGVSRTDRQVLALRPGAARIALQQALEPGMDAVPVVLPVGLHYADRHAYGSTVTVSVGEAVDLSPFTRLARHDHEGAVRALTLHLQQALRTLTLDLPEPELAAAVTGLEPVAGLVSRHGVWELASAQHVAARLADLQALHRPRFAALLRHCRAYRRARTALRLSDRAVHWDAHAAPWRQRTAALTTVAVLGSPAAAVGMLLNGAPWALGEAVARHVDGDPPRFSFARLSSGMVLYPVTWALESLILVATGVLRPVQVPWFVMACVLLGLWALSWSGVVRRLGQRLRRLGIETRHPRLLARARREQRALLVQLTVLQHHRDEGARPHAASPAGVTS